jgi:general nucleoside transport system permease protein
MSAATTASAAAATGSAGRSLPTIPRAVRPFAMVAFTLLLMALCRQFLDADGLTSPGTFGTSLGLAIPVAVAGLGGLICERAGIVNIALQGMLIMGTCTAGWMGYYWGPWAALLGGVLGGMVIGALHAFATVAVGVNHTVSGVALNLVALGMSRYVASVAFVGVSDGSITSSPSMRTMPSYNLPFFAGGSIGSWTSPDFFGRLHEKNWFFLSDVAGLLRGLTGELKGSTIIVLALFPIFGYLLWRTPWGLRLRSCGEKPSAADSLGINVHRMQWSAVLISGALAGLGGAWLAVEVGRYQQGQAGIRGFLALAAVVFGNWKIAGVFAGALLFQYPESLPLVTFGEEPRAVLVMAAIVFAVVAVVSLAGRRRGQAIGAGVLGAGALLWFLAASDIDESLVNAFPYVITLLVLIFSAQSLRPPANAGIVWRKGSS